MRVRASPRAEHAEEAEHKTTSVTAPISRTRSRGGLHRLPDVAIAEAPRKVPIGDVGGSVARSARPHAEPEDQQQVTMDVAKVSRRRPASSNTAPTAARTLASRSARRASSRRALHQLRSPCSTDHATQTSPLRKAATCRKRLHEHDGPRHPPRFRQRHAGWSSIEQQSNINGANAKRPSYSFRLVTGSPPEDQLGHPPCEDRRPAR